MSERRPPRLSASARVLLAMTAVLAVAVALLALVSYSVTVRTLTAQVDDVLRREAAAFDGAMRGAPETEGLKEATRAYLSARTGRGSGLNTILLVTFADGRTISNSQIRLDRASKLPAPTAVTEPRFSTVDFKATNYRVLSVPVLSSGTQVAVFRVAVSTDAIDETATRVAFALAAAGLIALGLGLPLSWWATRTALAPLTRMASDAAEVSFAQPGRRIAYEGPDDELGSLAHSLNAMLARLEVASDEQRRFVADASHELRTPVAVVRGNVELLRAGALGEEEAAESLAMIEDEAVRMSTMLEELLALSRFENIGHAHFQPLDVRVLIEEAAARGRALGSRTFKTTGPCDIWIEGDPDLLDRALANVVRNAVAHTEPGGTIELACEAADGLAGIRVTDDGPGIPAADLPHVFERFYRSASDGRDERSGGAGLGLAITRRIVELHGGAVGASNVEPHGARFTIELPQAPEPQD